MSLTRNVSFHFLWLIRRALELAEDTVVLLILQDAVVLRMVHETLFLSD